MKIQRNIVKVISGETVINYYRPGNVVNGFTLEAEGDAWTVCDSNTIEICLTEREALLTYADFIDTYVTDMAGDEREMHEAEIERARNDAERV